MNLNDEEEHDRNYVRAYAIRQLNELSMKLNSYFDNDNDVKTLFEKQPVWKSVVDIRTNHFNKNKHNNNNNHSNDSMLRSGDGTSSSCSVDDWTMNGNVDSDTTKQQGNNVNHTRTNISTTDSQKRRIQYIRNGFVHIPNFCSIEECIEMKNAMLHLVQNCWDCSDAIDSFGTGSHENIIRNDYFLESATKIHYFPEPTAVMDVVVVNDTKTSSTTSTTTATTKRVLKPEYIDKKLESLNKVGHALHWDYTQNQSQRVTTKENKEVDQYQEPTPASHVFHKYCISKKIYNLLVNDLGYIDPVVPQSMYIFKQKQQHHQQQSNTEKNTTTTTANAAGVVTSHQDSTFLFTEPYQTCIGLWLALDDATLENGCLWIRPKSHLYEPVRRQYQRNIQYFGIESINAGSNVPTKVSDPTTQSTTISGNNTDIQQQELDCKNLNDGLNDNETEKTETGLATKKQKLSSPSETPKFVMNELYDYHDQVPWEGGIPAPPPPPTTTESLSVGNKGDEVVDLSTESKELSASAAAAIENSNTKIITKYDALLKAGFIPIECKAGDLLLFHGELDHLSLSNTSNSTRDTFQLHLIDGPNANIVWSKYNWLQYPTPITATTLTTKTFATNSNSSSSNAPTFLRLLDYHSNST